MAAIVAQSKLWEGLTLSIDATDRQDLIDQLARQWTPHEIRDLAATLLRLADSLEQNWDGSNVRSIFTWPSEKARIERNAANLAFKARLLVDQRQRRRKHIANDLLGEPAWDMLLDLFMQFAGGAKVSTTSLCIAAQVPSSTALRYVNALEESDYVERTDSQYDKRVTLIGLTDKGVIAMGRYLESI